jgi:hypothetical protein
MKKIVAMILSLLVAGIGFLAWVLGPQLLNMKSEYVTDGVIRQIHAFVIKTNGQWPRSWQELPKLRLTLVYRKRNVVIVGSGTDCNP